MQRSSKISFPDSFIILGMILLTLMSTFVLNSVSSSLYPTYYIYIALALILFLVFVSIDFEALSAFSKIFYFMSVVLLIIPLIVGQVTRGAIRWIPIGSLTIQPSEIVRPFLLIFFANYLTQGEVTIKTVAKAVVFFLVPFFLILIQPSLGVSVLTGVGFLGVLIASKVKKRVIFLSLSAIASLIPISWFFLEPYQKLRIQTFLNPLEDPYGAGYNSIQSMITVGSGRIFGRGLGEGAQTQLAFLPERHSDFVFAAISEEFGFFGSALVLFSLFMIFWFLVKNSQDSKSQTAKCFISGVFCVLLAETFIHVGMNMGILPITGVPLPLVSAGGSALLGTVISLAIAISAKS